LAANRRSLAIDQAGGAKCTARSKGVYRWQSSITVVGGRDRWVQWRENHLDTGQYRHGMLAWIMEAPRRFRVPVPSKGRLGLFKPSDDVIQQLSAAEAEAD
jgi:hypothetical protein